MIPLNLISKNFNLLEIAKINFLELTVARLSAFFSVAPTVQHLEIYPPGTCHVEQVARPSNQTCLVCLINQNWHASDTSDWNWPIPDWQKHYGMVSECRNSVPNDQRFSTKKWWCDICHNRSGNRALANSTGLTLRCFAASSRAAEPSSELYASLLLGSCHLSKLTSRRLRFLKN